MEKDIEITRSIENRERIIVRTSTVGIVANVFLSAFKAIVGISTNSIAILLDAVNNISDALSSIITIIGIKLAGKAPDREHPLGHGRVEYITTVLISGFVLYAGAMSFIESVKKILNPETPDYSTVSLIIMAVAIAVKLFLSIFFERVSKKVKSDTLSATGKDAGFDAILSLAVLLCALLSIYKGIYIEAWISAVISGFIIKAGIEMMHAGLSEILGKRADIELVTALKEAICQDPDVSGAFDLFLYNYGPDKNYGSVHVEVLETLNAKYIDSLTRRIQERIYKEYGVILTAIGIYAISEDESEQSVIRRQVYEIVMSNDGALQFHGFYLDEEAKKIIFDVVLSFDCDREKTVDEIKRELYKLYPEFEISITVDLDIS